MSRALANSRPSTHIRWRDKFKKAFQDANESEGFINLILIQLKLIRLVLANCHVLLSAHVTTDYNILQSQSELMKWPPMNLISLNLIVYENQIDQTDCFDVRGSERSDVGLFRKSRTHLFKLLSPAKMTFWNVCMNWKLPSMVSPRWFRHQTRTWMWAT